MFRKYIRQGRGAFSAAALIVTSILGMLPAIADVSIETQPSHSEKSLGESVTLSVEADGRGLRYQWYKNGIMLSGKTEKSLPLSRLKASDSGTYHVRVTDNSGDREWSAPGIVTVNPASGGTINICNINMSGPRDKVLVVHPEDKEALEGRNWFAQPFVGKDMKSFMPVGPPVPFYDNEALHGVWYKQPNLLRTVGHASPGEEVLVQFRVWQFGTGMTFEEALDNKSDFFASNIFKYSLGGAGSPPSIPSSPNGLEEFFFNSGLPVTEATILDQSTHTSVLVGDNVELSIKADGPGIKYKWLFNGIALDGQTSASIGTSSITLDNAGTYQAIVTDENGKTAVSEPIVVLVNKIGGGSFNFCNIGLDPGQRNVPVIHPGTNSPLTGTGWFAQPFVGADEFDLLPIGPAVPFYDGQLAGLILKNPTPTRIASHLKAGSQAFFQVRVWKAGEGTSFDEAFLNGSDYFASNIFGATLGGVGSPPSLPVDMDGLKEFYFNDGLPVKVAEIRGQSDHVQVGVGESFSLSVEAVGPDLTYNWYFNGVLQDGLNADTLSFSRATADVEGTYHVVVKDSNGNTATSSPIVVLLQLTEGGSFNFCNIALAPDNRNVPVVLPSDGMPVAGTAWFAQPFVGSSKSDLMPVGPAVPFYDGDLAGLILKNPTPTRRAAHLDGGSDATIQFRVWQAGTGTSFEQALENGSNYFASNIFTAKLGGAGTPPTVPVDTDGLVEFFYNSGLPPKEAEIVNQSAHASLILGEPLSLSVEATGPGLKFEWFRNGMPVSGATSDTYKVNATKAADEGTYHVVVTDENGISAVSNPMVIVLTPTSGGYFNFCNIGVGDDRRNVFIIHPETKEPLSGTTWYAQPFVGNHRYDMEPVGPAVPFYDGNLAGLILKNPTPTRRAEHLAAGTEATFQIRVWQAGTGADFESAISNGSNFFASNIFTEELGGKGSPPSLPVDMDGLTEFFYNDGLPPQVAAILEQPDHVFVQEGSDISISVVAEGPNITYQWFRNGHKMEDADSDTIKAADATLDMQATYDVIVTDENGVSVLSEPAIVIITPRSGGGSINICNIELGPERLQVPVIHPETKEGLMGRDWLAQPFVGSSPFDMKPVGPAVPFYDDKLPGVYRKEITPVRNIPHITPGDKATIQIRVWEAAKGPGFDEALANGSNFFASNIFQETTGGAGSPPSFPPSIAGLKEFMYNDGLPDVNVFWPNPAAITYGTPLSDAQLNARTSTPGSFRYSPDAGTILDAGVHKLTALFTPDNDEFEPMEISVQLVVEKAIPEFTGRPSANWPVETPLEAYLFSGLVFNTPGQITGTLNGGRPIQFGITTVNPNKNRINLTFNPEDANNFLPVDLEYEVNGLKPKKKEVKPKKTVVKKDAISIELPVEPNTYYQIEVTTDFINWEVVFVSNDDTSAEFNAALDEFASHGFYRIRSYTTSD